MPSINDISIAVNDLFMDIIHPMTLAINKSNFFESFPNTFFKFENQYEFEFHLNPLYRFDKNFEWKNFLSKEKNLANIYNDLSNLEDVEEMMKETAETQTLGDFFLDYSIENDENKTLIIFNTNSLIFKYEVIG